MGREGEIAVPFGRHCPRGLRVAVRPQRRPVGGRPSLTGVHGRVSGACPGPHVRRLGGGSAHHGPPGTPGKPASLTPGQEEAAASTLTPRSFRQRVRRAPALSPSDWGGDSGDGLGKPGPAPGRRRGDRTTMHAPSPQPEERGAQGPRSQRRRRGEHGRRLPVLGAGGGWCCVGDG